MSLVWIKCGRFSFESNRSFFKMKECTTFSAFLRRVDPMTTLSQRVVRNYGVKGAQRSQETATLSEASQSRTPNDQALKSAIGSPPHWESFQTFPRMIEQRRREARKSIIVEVLNKSARSEVALYCKSFGLTNSVFFYSVDKKNYVLVEFNSEEIKEQVLAQAGFAASSKIIPVSSSYLWFKPTKESVATHNPHYAADNIPNVTQDTICDENAILQGLQDLKNVKDQMHFLHNSCRVSDFSTRLRFLTCCQIEKSLCGVFPHARAYPFGSSVSGFGRNSADLDIFLQFLPPDMHQVSGKQRLIFHAKSWREDNNLQLKFVGDLLSVMLPACTNVRSIMGARVPIIKYLHLITNLECDVQNSSASGVDMTHILWIMCNWDPRVGPLVHTLRYWAKVNRVTRDIKPSPFITNFNLILLIIFYLQVENILPTLNFLEKSANHRKAVRYDTQLSLNFLQDIKELPAGLWVANKNPSLDELLLSFFAFYSKFDFESKSISIIDGKVHSKPDSRAMWLVNPLYPSMNTSRNVNGKGVETFQRVVRESHSLLQRVLYSNSPIGLLQLIPEYKEFEMDNALGVPRQVSNKRLKRISNSDRK